MNEKRHTLGETLARLNVDIENMNEFLYSLQKMLESNSENINLEQRLDDGTTKTITVPSFGYLKGRIDKVDENFNRLVSTNDDVVGIRSTATGDVRKFELKKVSQLISDLEQIEGSSFEVPTEFRIKNNWFFESFLNPLLFVSVDITSVITDDIDRFSVKRIIINSIEDDDKEFFDTNYKNNNEIDLDTLVLDLENNGIDYIEDDNVVELPVGINRYRGTFDVLRMFEEEVIQIVNGGEANEEEVSVVRRRYKLNTLQYTDVLSGSSGSRVIAEGDVLITTGDSEYKVVSINLTDSEVILERVFGIQPVTIGADIFRINPDIYRIPELQVNVGFNERQAVFVKPISRKNNVTTDAYSNGFGVYTNELTIPLDDDSESTLEDYYTNFVADFGMILLNSAKERKLPSIVAEEPDAPVVSASNFDVIEIDQHIKEDENITQLQGKVKEKEDINSKKKETDRKLDELKAQLTTTVRTDAEKQRIEKDITKKTKDRKVLQDRLSTVIKDLTLSIATTPQFVRTPKFRVRGFWQIPDAKSSTYGKQEVVQFKYRYRYLSKKGSAPNATQQELTEANGTKKFAVFSPWTEMLTKARTKVLDEETGLYVWEVENVTDADEVNINQLDIAIRRGETVEIQVRSLSEAGWPDNAAMSVWSDSVQVEFPEGVESSEEGVVISQKIFAEEARIDFEDELVARGLDLHLGDQFTTGERFFPHKTDNVASGFYTTEGNVIDLYEKLKAQDSEIEALRQAIELARGVIKVSLIDPEGNVNEVVNGQTLDIFGGYYRDAIKDTSGGTVIYNEGRIITRQYTMSIENTSETRLELITLLQGGINEVTPESNPIAYPDSDYHINRRYDLAPLAITEIVEGDIAGIKHIPSAQSGQVKSQYTYARYKDYGLTEELYASNPTTGDYTEVGVPGNPYDYNGQIVDGDLVSYNWGHYLPFDPSFASTFSQNVNVWNGVVAASVPGGDGYLSEFCIHVNHPELKTLGVAFSGVPVAIENFFRPRFNETVSPPLVDAGARQKYLPFAHALHFEASENELTNKFGVSYFKQANRKTPVTIADNDDRLDENYPIKLGFTPNDEYLIGKYTCGSYLYPFPLNYQTISVEGNHPLLSFQAVEVGSKNAINVPILFQFRCSDILGNIGGFRTDGTLRNIKYTKKIGIDIYVKDDVPFSFDLQVNCRYRKETSLDAPIIPARGLGSVTF